MIKFRLLGAVLAVAAGAFTMSCDKESLPVNVTPGNGPIIGDGSTSGIVVDALLNDQLTDLTVTLGEEVIGSNLNFKEVTEALELKTGESVLNVTAFDTEQGKFVEIYNDYVTVNDEQLYMFVITLDEEGVHPTVQILDYTSDDLQINDELALELGYESDNMNLSTVNVANYNIAYQNEELVIDLGLLSEGVVEHTELGVLGYGSESATLLNNEGSLSSFDLILLGEEYTEILEGENGQTILLSALLDNLTPELGSVAEGDFLNFVLFGDENNFDFIAIDFAELNIDFITLDVE